MGFLANPWAILALVAALVVSHGAAYLRGRDDGGNAELATQYRESQAAAAAADSAASAAAYAISRIEVRNVTVQRALEREVFTKEVFRECRSGPDAVRLLNSGPGIAPAASTPGGGELPASGTAR